MRFGASTWIWVAPLTTVKLVELAPRVRRLGFDWIEIPIDETDAIDYQTARQVIADNGLGVSVCIVYSSPQRDLLLPDPKMRASAMAYVRHCIDATQTMGGTIALGPHYAEVGRKWYARPERRAREMELLVSELQELAGYAEERGVTLCLEPINRYEASFVTRVDQAIEIVDKVGHPAFQMMVDTFHMNMEEPSLGDAIRAAGSRLRHVHSSESHRGTPGEGHLPWGEVAQALRDIQYDGALVIETFNHGVESLATAAAIWQPQAETQDALAQRGVAFLRKLMAA